MGDAAPEDPPSTVRCPGCGLALPVTGAPRAEGVHASGECWERYGALGAALSSPGDVAFSLQHAVDAYAAQHPGGPSKPITTWFALVGLFLFCEHGLSGRAVQRAHQALAREKQAWPVFEPPADLGAHTVLTVLDADPGEARAAALRLWAAAVWTAWRDQHGPIRELVAQQFPGAPRSFERPRR